MKRAAIVDYGMGNIDSVVRAVEEAGGDPVFTNQGRELERASHIILPGVGAFAIGMQNIRKLELDRILNEQVVDKGIPFLGICLGMQLLATKGCEGGETDGFGWIDGRVKMLEPTDANERIPHIGWNEVNFTQESRLFNEIPSGKDFYFVHSYHFLCRDDKTVLARTPYCGDFVSAVVKGNIFGLQFHPEKSQRVGLQVIKNFLSL